MEPKDVQLPVYPIYLDADMVVSLLAALEGGVTFEEQLQTTIGESSEDDANVAGRIGLGGALASIFSAEIGAGKEHSSSDSKETVVGLVRRQTEASLFNALRARLDSYEFIARPQSGSLDGIEPGSFVELQGRLRRSSLGEMISAMERYQKRFETVLSGSSGAPSRTRRGSQKGRGGGPGDRQRTPEEAAGDQGLALLRAIDEDLREGPYEDVAIDSTDGSVRAVCLLRRDIASPRILASLAFGTYWVLGKVTAVHREGEVVDMLRRTFMTYIDDTSFRDAIGELVGGKSIRLGDSLLEVKGPALEVLPLAIFV